MTISTRSRAAAFFVVALAFGGIAWGTLTPGTDRGPPPPSWCFLCAEVNGLDVVLNVLLFIPFGIGLRVAGVSRRKVLAIAAVVTLAIEVIQWLFVSGRIASFGDLIANVLGAATGMVFAERWREIILPESSAARKLASASLLAWFIVQVLTALAFAPSLKQALFYGQISADLGHMDRFTGRVIAARIEDATVPDGPIKDTEPLRRVFENGARVTAWVTPGDPTESLAPIVSVFSHEMEEIFVLGQERHDLVFRMRTRGSNARLRTPTISLWGAFPSRDERGNGHRGDTLLLSGWRSGSRLYVGVTTPESSVTRSVTLRPSYGWALMIPFENTWMPVAQRYTAIWMTLLLFPAGYWALRGLIAGRAEPRKRSALAAALRVLTMLGFAALVLGAGFIALPLLLGLPAAGDWEWGGALAGIGSGLLAGALGTWLEHSRSQRVSV